MGSKNATRRRFIQSAFGLVVIGSGKYLQAALQVTPAQAEGPFYPIKSHRFEDTDQDLVKIESATKAAGGQILYLTGNVSTPGGVPMSGVYVEIWQCDINGRYIHPRDSNGLKKDPYFQGFGRALTTNTGQYHFKTIKPVAYQSRTPHIHFKVIQKDGVELLTTQMYFEGEPLNRSDSLYGRLSDDGKKQLTVSVDKVKSQELISRFDIVIGT